MTQYCTETHVTTKAHIAVIDHIVVGLVAIHGPEVLLSPRYSWKFSVQLYNMAAKPEINHSLD